MLKEVSKASLDAVNFEQALREHMEVFAKKYGLAAHPMGGSIMPPNKVVLKYEFILDKTTEAGKEAERKAFDRRAFLFNMKPEDYGRKFINRGEEFQLIGFEPNRPKFAYRGRRVSDGKELLFSAVKLI